MKKLLTLNLLLLLLMSCSHKRVFADWDFNKEKPAHTSSITGTPVKLGDLGIVDCFFIHCKDSLALLRTNTKKQFVVVNITTGDTVGTYLYEGNGPNEMIDPRVSGFIDEMPILFSLGDRKTYKWDLATAVNDNETRLIEFCEVPPSTFAILKGEADTSMIAIHYGENSFDYSILNASGEIKSNGTIYEDIDLKTDITYLSYTGTVVDDKLVCAMQFFPQINFISLKDKTKKAIVTAQSRVRWNNIFGKIAFLITMYYNDIEQCGDYIVAMYVGQTSQEYYENPKSVHLHVFDKDGNFISDVATTESLRDLEYNAKNGILYGLGFANDLYSYPLNELTRQ